MNEGTRTVVRFQVAQPQHEREIRELIGNSPMPGWVRLAFGRDPDFFQGLSVQGKENQALIALEEERVVGLGCRSIKPVYLDGKRADIGYLGGLRLHPAVRRTTVLARGYAALRKLHEANPVPVYLTTVIEDNSEARRLLESQRAGLPCYLEDGRYFTCAINLNRYRHRHSSPIAIRRGDEIGPEAIVRFLEKEGSRRQFFPVIETQDFNSEYLRGLSLKDFRVAIDREGQNILGVVALWDQHAFKQNRVVSYAPTIGWMRPVLNAALCLTGFRNLPAPGETLNSLYLSFPCVRGDDVEILRALLEHIYLERRNGTHHYLLIGFHERDPLRSAVSHFLTFQYISRFYRVCWEDGLDFVRALDSSRIPYLELATL